MSKKKSKTTKERIIYKKPSFEKYKKALYKSSPRVRKELHTQYTKAEAREAKEEAKKKLYAGQIRREKIKKGIKVIGVGVEKLAKKKIKVKRIVKPSRITVQIREHTPLPYVSRFFKDEWEEAKKAMFFR